MKPNLFQRWTSQRALWTASERDKVAQERCNLVEV